MLKMKKIILLLVIIIALMSCSTTKEVFNADSFISYLREMPALIHYELSWESRYQSLPAYEINLVLQIDISDLRITYKGETLAEIKEQIEAFRKQLKEGVF